MDIRGLTVHEIWIEGASQIEAELLRSIVFDHQRPGAPPDHALPARRHGTSSRSPTEDALEAIATLHADPLLGFPAVPTTDGSRSRPASTTDLVRPIEDYSSTACTQTFVAEVAMLVEVNSR